MRVKICGITKAEQGIEIAALGATALGFICTSKSPRYLGPLEIKAIVEQLPQEIGKIGVFVNASIGEIIEVVAVAGLTGVQLHGEESPEFCWELKSALDEIEIIKAIAVKNWQSLAATNLYCNCGVDTLLLDAYHPQMRGGTGQTIKPGILREFRSPLPWLLAGGLTPDNVTEAVRQTRASGIDLSSGVEIAPGDKDLNKVKSLLTKVRTYAIKTEA